MPQDIRFTACSLGNVLPLCPDIYRDALQGIPAHFTQEGPWIPPLPAGTGIAQKKWPDEMICMATGHVTISLIGLPHAIQCPKLTAMRDITAGETPEEIVLSKSGLSLAWITLSDTGARGGRTDTSGPLIAEILGSSLPICLSQGFLLPDDAEALRTLLTECALRDRYDIICTSGGTGLTARDITPQTTARVLDLELPGFVQSMMMTSLAKTPKAVLSRACAGILGQSLVINLPGSEKAVRENLEAVLPALDHTIAKLHNDTAPCGG